MILSDTDLVRSLPDLFPPDLPGNADIDVVKQVQPASIDLRLSTQFKVFEPLRAEVSTRAIIDPRDPSLDLDLWTESVETNDFVLYPGQFVLAATIETIRVTDHFAVKVDGRSSLGRLGVRIHSTAGFIDPGFTGRITLEMDLASPWPVRLRAGMRVCQVSVHVLSSRCTTPYGEARGSKYDGQSGPQNSLINKDKP